MYYRNRNLSGGLGAVLNNDNAAKTLAAQDIVRAAETNGEVSDAVDERESGVRAPRAEMTHNSDFGLMQALYGGVSKKLLAHVKMAVAKNCYEGSPLMRDIGPDRASLDKVINEVLDMACAEYDEAQEICLENDIDDWEDMRLLYDLTESLVLAEIFLNKRLKAAQ